MVEWHTKSKKKISGGKRKTVRRCTKKNAWRGGEAANTKTGEHANEKRETNKKRGNTKKIRLTGSKFVNVNNGEKVIKAEILSVEENLANRLFARSNIVTKGAKLKVKLGKDEKIVIVTNRPGQDGIINAKMA